MVERADVSAKADTCRTLGIDDLGSALDEVFHIDVETCSKCCGAIRVIACIEDPVVIDKILTHLDKKAALAEPVVLPQSRAPPQRNLFG